MRYRNFTGVYALAVLLLWSFNLSAQNITEKNWLFGNSTEYLVFDKSGRDVVVEDDQATPFGTGGSAVISNQYNGDLIFYTDGQSIYDAEHNLLTNSLSGNIDLNQAAVACPIPGSTDQYYIFVNSGSAIEYTIVDASLQGNGSVNFPLGEVTGTVNASTGLTDPSEGMVIIEAGNGVDYWLLSQNKTSYEINITSITSTGLNTTTLALFTGSLPGFEVNQFAFNNAYDQIALTPKNINRNVVIVDFDPATGTMTYNNAILNSGQIDEIYDAEWSVDGTKLYFSVLGDSTGAGMIYHVDMSDSTSSPRPVNEILSSPYNRSFGLKLGQDGRIYHLYQLLDGSPITLGRFDDTDSTFDLVQYDSLVFNNDFNSTQFPACAPAQMASFITVAFDYLDSCQRQATQFFPRVDPEPNNYFWDFGDGTFSFSSAPLHTYDAPGSYNVTLLAELNGRFGTFTQLVNIIAADSADLGEDTTICIDEKLELDPGVTGVEYLWSTGETTAKIEVDTGGTYWVYVTLAGGCTTYDDIVVTEYGANPAIGSQWYFGEHAGLDFTGGAPVPITDANLMDSPEGCASISDINGDLLFYTNGVTVWNKNHDIMINGEQIGGDSTSVQAAVILPFAEDATQFYIFTTEEVYGDDTYQLKYTIVDLKADSARGHVIKKGMPLIHESTERVTISGFTGNPYLIGHEFGNNNFRAYNINPDGISAASHSSIGEPHDKENELEQRGAIKFSPLGSQVGVLIPGGNNHVEIFDFTFNTGAVSNPRLIDLNEPSLEAYGLEFSSSGLKLYVSLNGATGRLLQYDLDSLFSENSAADIEATKYSGYPSSVGGYGTLQMGPDGVIYLAVDGQSEVGTLSGSDNDDGGAIFDDNGQDLGGRTSRLGLPNYTQEAGTGSQPSITVSVACMGQETTFSGTGRDNSIETYQWDFGDGSTTGVLNSPDTTHIYLKDSTYIVSLTLSNRCDIDTIMYDTITVYTIPEAPLVPTDTALCGGSVTLTAWDEDRPDLHYYWSTGDTTRIVTFTEPMVVSMAVYNDDGCGSDTVDIFIGDGGNVVDLGPDIIVCQNDTGPTLDGTNVNSVYEWYRDGVLVGEEATEQVNTGESGTFIYMVAVTNTITGCTATDSVEINILPEPGLTQTNIIYPDCSEANGSFQLEFANSGNYSYEVAGPVNLGPFTFDGPGVTPALENLSSGSYIITATNTVTGCQNIEVMLLEDDAPFEMEATSHNDCFKSGDIRVILRNFVGSRVDIEVLDEYGAVVYSEMNRSAINIKITDLDTGVYYVTARQVIDPQCLQADTVRLITELSCYRTIVAPNAFSPNGNGLNEEFFVYPNEYIDDFQIFIYNRWGQIVYTSKDKNFRWDGIYGNQLSPPGTYAYKMVFTSSLEPEIGDITQYGSVTLIR